MKVKSNRITMIHAKMAKKITNDVNEKGSRLDNIETLIKLCTERGEYSCFLDFKLSDFEIIILTDNEFIIDTYNKFAENGQGYYMLHKISWDIPE